MGSKMDKHHDSLLKTFHTLCRELGMSKEDKMALIGQYNVESSADLDTHDLINICGTLENLLNKQRGHNLDLLRKRVIAAIGGWLDITKEPYTMDTIKGIACQATGYKSFNKIPSERLRNIYGAFTKKQNDYKAVNALINGGMQYQDKTIN